MPLRRLAPLILVGLAACFVDVGPGVSGGDGSSSAADGSSTGPDSSVDDAGEASDTNLATSNGPFTASSVETTDADPTTGGPDPTGVTDSATSTTMTTDPSTTLPMTTDPATTDEPAPICGDGVLEQGEDCDDGNFNNLDYCLDNCTAANCFDGYINQDEIDGDCGGSCGPCGPCRLCNDDSGCADGLGCIGGLCNEYHTVQFDYFTECGLNDTVFAGVDLGNYPGAWRVEALAGGGLVEENSGWGWLASCTGFDLDGLGTPFIHASAEDAFTAINPKSIVVDYAGGPTRCGILESLCDDNFGGSQLGFTLACN